MSKCWRWKCGGEMHIGRFMAWCVKCKATRLPHPGEQPTVYRQYAEREGKPKQ